MSSSTTMTIEEMLAAILTKLEEMQVPWPRPSTPSSPSSIPIPTADIDDREASTSTISTKPATASSASLIPPLTSTPPQHADPGFPSQHADSGFLSGVTGLPEPPVSTDGHIGLLFDADADSGSVDRLSSLPNSLLRNIVSRLPIKDAARTAMLSRSWSPIWRAAPLIFDSAELGVLHLNRLNVNHLGFCSVDFLPAQDPACMATANLFAVQRGMRVVSDTDARNVVLGNNPTTGNLVTAALASRIPSLTPAPSLEAISSFQLGTTDLLHASPTRCSTLSLCQYAYVPMIAIVSQQPTMASLASTPDQDAKLDNPVTTTELAAKCSVLCFNANTGTDKTMAAFLLAKEELKGVLSLVQSVDVVSPQLLVNAELDMLVTCKCSLTPHFVRYSNEITAAIVLSLVQLESEVVVVPKGLFMFFKLRPTPWPSYCQYRDASQFLSPWPPPAQRFVTLPSCIHCTLYWPDTGCLCFLSYWEIHMCKMLWLQNLGSAAQTDEGNSRGDVDLSLSSFSHIWLFIEILAAEKYRVISSLYELCALAGLMLVTSYTHHVLYKLLSGVSLEFEPWPPPIQILSMHLVSSYTFQLEGHYTQLELKDGNLTHGHCQLLTCAIGFIVRASQMASESLKSGWLIAEVNLWLLWTPMSTYQLFMLVWLMSSYKENVELIFAASISQSLNWVWPLLLKFASFQLEKVEQSLLVQLLGVIPNFILNLAWDCLACGRAMSCTEAVYVLKTVYSTYISCGSSTPSVPGIQVFEICTGGQFGQFLIIYTNGSKCAWGRDSSGGHFRHDSVTPLLWLGIFTMVKDSVDTYCTAPDIKYTAAITWVQNTAACFHVCQMSVR